MQPCKLSVHLLALAAGALLLAACAQMGRQDPKVFQGVFSPSGNHYAYIYQSTFIWTYQRTGGRSVSHGSLTNYLQVVDTASGRRLLEKPLKIERSDCTFPQLGTANDVYVVIACQGHSGESLAPMVFSLATGTFTLTGATLLQRNPGMALDGAGFTDFRRDPEQPDAVLFQGKDGRTYRLNPESGAAQAATGKFESFRGFSRQLDGRLPEGLDETGDGRRYIVRDRHPGQRSQADFLKPKFLFLGPEDGTYAYPATLFDGGLLVLSCTDKTSGQHKLLALVDAQTLATRWSTPLPQTRGDWANGFDEEQFVQQGNQLLLANASQLLRIDLMSGKIVGNVNLVE